MEDFWKSVQTIQTERGVDYRADGRQRMSCTRDQVVT